MENEADRYREFFKECWAAQCNNDFDPETGHEITMMAVKHGLVVEELYDPEIHGETLGSEWDLEKGDPCYVLTKRPENKANNDVGDLELIEKVAEALRDKFSETAIKLGRPPEIKTCEMDRILAKAAIETIRQQSSVKRDDGDKLAQEVEWKEKTFGQIFYNADPRGIYGKYYDDQCLFLEDLTYGKPGADKYRDMDIYRLVCLFENLIDFYQALRSSKMPNGSGKED